MHGQLLPCCSGRRFAFGHLAEGSDPGLPAARFGLKTSLAGYRELPVALYVALTALLLAGFLLLRTLRSHRPGRIASLGLVLAGAAQFLLSFFRLPYLYAGPTPLRVLDPIQWVALVLVVSGCAVAVVPGSEGWERPEVRMADTTATAREPFAGMLGSDELVEGR